MNKHDRNRWKRNTPVNLALDLNSGREDEPTQKVHVTDPDLFAEDCQRAREDEPTQRRIIAHSYAGVIDEMEGGENGR